MIEIARFLAGFLYGARDSFLGLFLLFNIDKNKQDHVTNKQDHVTKKSISPSPPRPGKKKEKKVLPMMGKCCFLNGGLLLLSVLIFENIIIPGFLFVVTYIQTSVTDDESVMKSNFWSWLEPTMTYTFCYLWVIPLSWLSKVLNCFWFIEIADVAYKRKHGRPVISIVSSKDGIYTLSKTMADFIFSIKVEVLFLIQAQVIGLVPAVGPYLSFLHMSLLYSLYAFEYTWANLGWSVVRRLDCIERNWPYFLGFGLILTTLTSYAPSAVIGACLFGITFPLFILSGLEARPFEGRGSSGGVVPLRVFSFVIWITNKILLFKTAWKKSSAKN